MEIIKITAGAFQTNTYILKQDGESIIIDASGKIQKVLEAVEGTKVKAILLTHGHFDHIKIVDELKNQLDVKIYLSKLDEPLARDRVLNSYGDFSAVIKSSIEYLPDDTLKLGNFEFKLFHAPGHTEGSYMFLIEDILFSGDVIFKNSIGRTDLFSGNEKKMKQSLRMFKDFDRNIKIFPGHGENTTVEDEINNNYFLKNF